MKNKKWLLAIALIGLFCFSAQAELLIVTTTQDMAALAREVAGEWAKVDFIAKGYQDPHFVDAKPSYLLKLKKADLFIEVGLELEVAWAGQLLTNARNSKILPGGPGFLDASQGCDILDLGQGVVDRSQGDVHPFGNPHYWLDPSNGRVVARSIAKKLFLLDGAHAKDYERNLAQFEAKLTQKEKEWDLLATEHLKGVKVVTYHNSWPNFAKRFGIEVVGFVEPKPGIPPSPAHLQSLKKQMTDENVSLLLMEPYFDDKLPAKIAKESGAKLLIFPPSVGAQKGIQTYFDLFDREFEMIQAAVRHSKMIQ